MATCAARWQCLSKNSAAIPYHRHRPQEPAMTDTKAVAKPLTPEAEHVLRRHGTERPGSSKLNHEKRPGVFRCAGRSEEHTSELQSLMRISYAGFCLKKKNKQTKTSR